MNDGTTNSGLAPETTERNDELAQTVARLEKEIRARKRAEKILQAIAEGTAKVTGTEFFTSFVRQLATIYDVKCALVAELVDS